MPQLVGSIGTVRVPSISEAASRSIKPAALVVDVVRGSVPAKPSCPAPRPEAPTPAVCRVAGSEKSGSTGEFMSMNCGAGSLIRAPRLRRARERAEAAAAAAAEIPAAGALAPLPSLSVGPNLAAGGSSCTAYTM
ncbi:Uncharacterised protein [Mycobacteroides abscessus subsp. abscessus]|nr:Uncharacterised protein [Mycobacteroides abscessus subsp. abscessus]SHR29340.1 Uncharacterised protein [Mycobacteroides abscessus subsp. abscessus]SHR52174.1 Uncharacterised protein [Mycobacteroides abscessus subsp. abscessus]SHS65362.1 Uncharacterised protein [Mycobacteroides abscessus subsp. abscessus]SHT49739.1 Uncharacterised protein [Mycobacteroides abscessus subsp. abscessus]